MIHRFGKNGLMWGFGNYNFLLKCTPFEKLIYAVVISTVQKARTFRWKMRNGISHSDTFKCLASVEILPETLA